MAGENYEKVSYFEVGMANGKDRSDGGRGVDHEAHSAAGAILPNGYEVGKKQFSSK